MIFNRDDGTELKIALNEFSRGNSLRFITHELIIKFTLVDLNK